MRLITALLLLVGLAAQAKVPYKPIPLYRIGTTTPHCSAFVVVNKPNSDKDLVVTAAHCLTLKPSKPGMKYVVKGPWGGHLWSKMVGMPGTMADVAVLEGAVPENYEPVPISIVQPSFPFNASVLTMKAPEPKYAQATGIAPDGVMELQSRIRGGDSGSALLWRSPDGTWLCVGVVWGRFEPMSMGFAVPLIVLHEAIRMATSP